MDFNKAIRILGLTSNFTEEELRKNHRRLIAKYHPDKYASKSEKERKEAEEITKQINEAKDFLEKHKKEKSTNEKSNTRQNNNSYKSNDVVEVTFKKEHFKIILNKMKNELSSIPNIILDDMLKNTRDDIMYLIKTLESQTNSIYTLSALKILENTYYNRISNFLNQYEKDYCKKYNITLGNKKLERYSLKKLYEQLEQIKKEQNGFSIEELLEKELNKYVYYSGYQVITKLINNIKKDIIFENSIAPDPTEKIINEFNKRVLKEFKEYYKRLEVLNSFKQTKITKSKFIELLTLLEENIAIPEMFKYYEKKLVNILADLSSSEIVAQPTQEIKNYNTKYINNNMYKEEYIKKDYNINKEIYPKHKIKKKI